MNPVETYWEGQHYLSQDVDHILRKLREFRESRLPAGEVQTDLESFLEEINPNLQDILLERSERAEARETSDLDLLHSEQDFRSTL